MTGTCLQHCWGHGSFKSPVGTAWERGWVGLGPGDTPSTLCRKGPHVHFQEGLGFIDKEAEAPRGHVTGSSPHTLAGGRAGNQSQLSYTQLCFCKKNFPTPSRPSYLLLGNRFSQTLLVVKVVGRQLGQSLNSCLPSSRGSSHPRDRTRISCLLDWHVGSLP